ncbi:MAG: response regulator, partial [Bacteroidota bacterium]
VEALKVNLEALALREASDNKRGIAFSLTNIGLVYYEINEPLKSLSYHQRATELYQELKLQFRLGISLTSTAKVYQKLDSLKKSLSYERKALKILKQVRGCFDLDPMIGMAATYEQLGIGDSALYYNRLILERSADCGRTDLEMLSLIALARHDFQNKKLTPALQKLNRARSLSIETGRKEKQKEAAELQYQVYEQMANYPKAFERLVEFHSLSDSLFNQSKARELSQVEAKYQFDQEKQQLLFDQEKETLKLENEKSSLNRKFLWAIAGLFIFLITIAIVVNAYRDKAQLARKLEESNDKLEDANAKLHQLDQFKTRLFANINHDIRTPLTLIRGYAVNIQQNEDNYLTDASEQDLNHLQQNTMLLSEMTNEIQDLLLLEESKLKLTFNRIEITQYIERLVMMFSSLADLSGIDLKFDNRVEGECIVHLDQGHFDKIFYNLISNAFRYTAATGKIIVSIQAAASHAVLQIADNGKGISQEDLPHIFDRFYQSPLNEYRSKEGFGIGLAVVRELVNLHNGDISVESNVGVGTTFSVQLPLNLDKAAEAPLSFDDRMSKNHPVRSARATMISTREEDRQTILVVDDHEEVRNYIISVLEKSYQVKAASDGRQAITLLEKNHVDLVITDLMMPWLDGYDLIEELGSSNQYSSIPVMVVSARTTEEDKHRVLDAGVNEFIAKPFDPMELKKRVQNVLISQIKHSKQWTEAIADQQTLSEIDQSNLKKLNSIIRAHVADPGLTTELIADELNASRSKAIRMIKTLTGKTPLNYIRELRMNYVNELIKKQKVKNATEAAKAVGMKHATHFAKQYKSHFGEMPSFGKATK